MLDLMYDVPSRSNITRIVITKEMVNGQDEALISLDEEEKSA